MPAIIKIYWLMKPNSECFGYWTTPQQMFWLMNDFLESDLANELDVNLYFS